MIVIFNMENEDRNFYYLTGIEEECNGVALWDGRNVKVLVSNLEVGVAEKYVKEVEVFKNADDLWNLLERNLRKSKVIGVNMKKISASNFRRLRRALKGSKIEDVSKKLEEMRMIKREEEIEKIKRAGEIASKVMKNLPDIIEVGKSEREIAAEIEYMARKIGADGFAFPTIVASGKNAKIIHANPRDKKIREKEPIIVDFGPMYKMYAVDVTRTFFIGESREFEKAYEKVRNAYEKVKGAVEEGVEAKFLHGIAVRELGKMVHSTGHGVGIEIHERPIIGPKSKEILKKGMIIAIEPAEYDLFGIRIENTLLVEEKGEELTKVPTDLEFALI